jgi:hypothetical protein
LRASGSGYASARATALLTGFTHPLPVAVSPEGAVLVGDWASGKIYRIARA